MHFARPGLNERILNVFLDGLQPGVDVGQFRGELFRLRGHHTDPGDGHPFTGGVPPLGVHKDVGFGVLVNATVEETNQDLTMSRCFVGL